jgi:hypothetical protein
MPYTLTPYTPYTNYTPYPLDYRLRILERENVEDLRHHAEMLARIKKLEATVAQLESKPQVTPDIAPDCWNFIPDCTCGKCTARREHNQKFWPYGV